jgi:hypothetical protein
MRGYRNRSRTDTSHDPLRGHRPQLHCRLINSDPAKSIDSLYRRRIHLPPWCINSVYSDNSRHLNTLSSTKEIGTKCIKSYLCGVVGPAAQTNTLLRCRRLTS